MKKQENITKFFLNKTSTATIRLLVMILVSLFFVGFVNAFAWTSGVRAYYSFDDAVGTNVRENVTGTYNLTTYGSPDWVAGKLGNGLNFTGIDGQFANVNDSYYVNNSDFTISVWYKMVLPPPNYNALISSRGGAGSGNWALITYPNIDSWVWANQNDEKLYATSNWSDNTWHHLIVTRVNATGNYTFYEDGLFKYSVINTVQEKGYMGFWVGGTYQTVMGDRGGATGSPKGTIDELMILNRTANLTDVGELWNNGLGLKYNGSSQPNINVTLNSPINNYNQTSKTVIFNISSITYLNNIAVKNVTFKIDGIENQTDTSGLNGTYTFTKYLSYGTHNWSIDVYDNTSTLIKSSTRTITIGVYENSRTYTTPAMEGTVKTFILNISTGSPVTSAYLNYNGTLKSVNINANDFTTLTSSFVIPSVNNNTNVTFYWNVYTSLGNFVSSSSNQTINNLNFDNCSTNKIVLYNFTIMDEVSQNILKGGEDNTTGKVNIQIYPFGSLSLFVNYAQLMNITNPFYVCMNSSLGSDDKFSIDAQVEYDAILNAKEYYYIQNDTFDINYINNNISLYDLDNSNAQTFRIIYLDSSGIPVENAIIEIQRKYIEEDAYKIVEIAQTDKDGETQAKLQLNDVIYNFVIKKYGVTIDSFNKKFVRCDNYVYNLCEIKLNSFSSYIQTEDFTKGDDFEFTLTYNHSSRIITSVFNIPSGDSSLIVINATLLDNLGTTLACSDSITSSSGTLNCAVPNAIGNGTVYANVYKDGVLQGGGEVSLNTRASDIYGTSLVFLLIFLYLTLLGMGIGDNPIIMGVFMVLGVILAVTLNMVDTGVSRFVGAGATILWFIIAVIIVLIKGGKRG